MHGYPDTDYQHRKKAFAVPKKAFEATNTKSMSLLLLTIKKKKATARRASRVA